ncbi:hypothetical protein NEOLEDRAFT_1141643, partial [Neolentinus lepideus HHB14362 ss-1]
KTPCQDDQVWQARARNRADRAGRPLNRMPRIMHREGTRTRTKLWALAKTAVSRRQCAGRGENTIWYS